MVTVSCKNISDTSMSTKVIVDMSWEALLNNLGLNTADLLRHAQLPEDLFSQKHPTLTGEQYFRLVDSLEFFGEGEDWLLQLVQAVTPETFSPPLFAALCSQNLRAALERLSEFKLLICPTHMLLKPTVDGIRVTFEVVGVDRDMPASLSVMELAFLTNLARIATRQHIKPLEVVCPFTLGQVYHNYFGVAPIKGERISIEFSNDDLERPFLTSNSSMWDFFEPQLRQRLIDLQASDSSLQQRVYSLLLELLPTGKNSIEDAASKLAMSKRTLQRKLQAEDTNFKNILQSVRTHLAKHYLQREQLTGIEIALLLGFNSQSAFIRAFSSWEGISPEHYRNSYFESM